jgi:hypothetical protein
MNPKAHQPSREEVLDAFAVEISHDRETLERYLRQYPHFSNELVDLSRELSRTLKTEDWPLSSQEVDMIERAWLLHMPLETKSAKDPLANLSIDELRDIALKLEVPRQVLTAFRERRIVVASVPRRFLARLADALRCQVELLTYALTMQPSVALSRSYKADGKPTAGSAVSFEQLLIDAGVTEEKRTTLLADDN